MPLRLAYNTNGASNHRLDDALNLIAEAGYDGVALTVDHHHFDPFALGFRRRAAALERRLRQLGLGLVIETGARFLLDPRHKHEPTLISPDPAGRRRRIDFLTRCLDLCAACEGEAVSLWSGRPREGVDREEAMAWLLDGLHEVAGLAASRGVVACLEPEPGMLIETLDDWVMLRSQLDNTNSLRLALDLGHCLVTGERDPADAVREFAPHLGTVSIEDMKRGEHLHLPFGQGDLDLPATLAALTDIEFDRLVCVELSRESPRAHEAIHEAISRLRDPLPVQQTAAS